MSRGLTQKGYLSLTIGLCLIVFIVTELTIYFYYIRAKYSFISFSLVLLIALGMVLLAQQHQERKITLKFQFLFRLPIYVYIGLIVFLSDWLNVILTGVGSSTQTFITLKFAVLYILLSTLYASYEGGNMTQVLFKPYVYLCTFVAFSTIFVFILLLSGAIEFSDWIVNDDVLKKNIEGNGEQALYAFPLKLVLILVGDGDVNFGLFLLPRFSGISIEPAVSGFLLTPSLFYAKDVYKSKWLKVLFYVCMGSTIILHVSTTVLLGLGVCALLYLLKRNRTVFFGITIMGIIFLTSYLGLVEGSFIAKKFQSGSVEQSIGEFSDRFKSENLLGYSTFASRDSVVDRQFILENTSLLSTIGLTLFILLGLVYNGLMFLSAKKNESYYLAAVYLLVHSIKAPQHSFFYLFTFIVLLAPTLINKKD